MASPATKRRLSLSGRAEDAAQEAAMMHDDDDDNIVDLQIAVKALYAQQKSQGQAITALEKQATAQRIVITPWGFSEPPRFWKLYNDLMDSRAGQGMIESGEILFVHDSFAEKVEIGIFKSSFLQKMVGQLQEVARTQALPLNIVGAQSLSKRQVKRVPRVAYDSLKKSLDVQGMSPSEFVTSALPRGPENANFGHWLNVLGQEILVCSGKMMPISATNQIEYMHITIRSTIDWGGIAWNLTEFVEAAKEIPNLAGLPYLVEISIEEDEIASMTPGDFGKGDEGKGKGKSSQKGKKGSGTFGKSGKGKKGFATDGNKGGKGSVTGHY